MIQFDLVPTVVKEPVSQDVLSLTLCQETASSGPSSGNLIQFQISLTFHSYFLILNKLPTVGYTGESTEVVKLVNIQTNHFMLLDNIKSGNVVNVYAQN